MASHATTALSSWLASRGATVHPSLELFGEREGEARGVYALAPIEKNELLLRLPRAAAMCACEPGDAGSSWLPAAAQSMSAVVRTSLVLMRELALGKGRSGGASSSAGASEGASEEGASAWGPYLHSLPGSYNTLEFWTLPELEALRGTVAYDYIAKLRDGAGSLVGPAKLVYEKEVAPMVEAHPELWPDASLGAFLHAVAAVRTRGFQDAGEGGETGAAGEAKGEDTEALGGEAAAVAAAVVAGAAGRICCRPSTCSITAGGRAHRHRLWWNE